MRNEGEEDGNANSSNDGGIPGLLLRQQQQQQQQQQQSASVPSTSSTLPQEGSILNSLFSSPTNVVNVISNAGTGDGGVQDETRNNKNKNKNRSADQDGDDHDDDDDAGEDAALVDSFFLPGGLLADEDEQQQPSSSNNNNNNINSNIIVASPGAVGIVGHCHPQLESSLSSSAVPSNPWQEKSQRRSNDNNDEQNTQNDIQINYSGSSDDNDRFDYDCDYDYHYDYNYNSNDDDHDDNHDNCNLKSNDIPINGDDCGSSRRNDDFFLPDIRNIRGAFRGGGIDAGRPGAIIHNINYDDSSPMHVLTTLHDDGPSSLPVDVVTTPVVGCGSSRTPTSTHYAIAPPGFDHQQQQDKEVIQTTQFSYQATTNSFTHEEIETSPSILHNALSSDRKIVTSYSTAIQRQDGGGGGGRGNNGATAAAAAVSKSTTARALEGGDGIAYNNRLVVHQRHQSSGSTMGEELLMKVPSPKSSTVTDKKKVIGNRKTNNRRVTGIPNDEIRNNNKKTPKGSGRSMMMDQSISLSTPNLDRRVVGRSTMNNNNNKKNNSAKRTSPSRTMDRPSHNPLRPNDHRDDKRPTTSNIRSRHDNNSINIERKNFSEGIIGEFHGGTNGDHGGRDRRRGQSHQQSHHHCRRQQQQQQHVTYGNSKKYAKVNKDNIVATSTGVGEEETDVPGKSLKVTRGRKYGILKNENVKMNPNTPMNIYESLDVYEQDDDDDDDDLDDGDDVKHYEGTHVTAYDAGDVKEDDGNEMTKGRFGECVNNERRYINEKDNEDDQPRDNDADEVSIPLHVCDHSLSESSISSLSTSSDGDESSNSSDDEDDGEIHGEIGYDTDQAHVVSHIVGVGEGSTLAPKDIASTNSSAPNAVCPAEETPFSHDTSSNSGCNDDTTPENKQVCPIQKSQVEELCSRFRSIMLFPSKVWEALSDLWNSKIRGSMVYIYVVKAIEDILRLLHATKSTLHGLSLWISEAKDAVAALGAQFLAGIGVFLAGLTKALILTASFLFQVWKYSLIEAAEESSVTLCYVLFYFMPNFCYLLMEHINLPHWSPHMMSWLCVFFLCNQVESGPLHQEGDLSIFRTLTASTPGIMSVGTSTDAVDNLHSLDGAFPLSADATDTSCRSAEKVQRASENDLSDHLSQKSRSAPAAASEGNSSLDRTIPGDERACVTILKVLRLFLPGFFLVDGFSSEFGTIMGVNGASRLTTAFMMSLVRKNLVSSPIGWISWAVSTQLCRLNHFALMLLNNISYIHNILSTSFCNLNHNPTLVKRCRF